MLLLRPAATAERSRTSAPQLELNDAAADSSNTTRGAAHKLAKAKQDEGKFASRKLANLSPEPMWRNLDLFHMSDLAWPWFDVCHCDSSWLDD